MPDKTLPEPARVAAPVLGTAGRIVEGMGGAVSGVAGPLSVLTGTINMADAASDMVDNGMSYDNVSDFLLGGLGAGSGAAGMSGAAGTALAASPGAGLGATGTLGGAFGASALGAGACVAGAGLAGYGLGNLIAPLVYGPEGGTRTEAVPEYEGGTSIEDPATTGNSFVDWVFGV